MKQDVSMKLVSSQSDGEQKESTELISRAKYEKTEHGYKLTYDESEATGYDGATTTIELFGGEKVVMTRTGSVSSNLVVETGKKHHCVYGTPYGDLMVGVDARYIDCDLDDNGGRLAFKYVIDVNSSYVGDFDISIEVK
ncbi:MAG: DUF1934 domain-containing protein [Ruminococcus sp.]|nr:DUF1934 domain-containing protein [Ruminococcus sp.]MBP3268168.1 DUF1934 domain-containing protein [Ruminococcus sp.]MBR7008091.1 DUF1934 domain-containing protein [Ruminococcus sp.]